MMWLHCVNLVNFGPVTPETVVSFFIINLSDKKRTSLLYRAGYTLGSATHF